MSHYTEEICVKQFRAWANGKKNEQALYFAPAKQPRMTVYIYDHIVQMCVSV